MGSSGSGRRRGSIGSDEGRWLLTVGAVEAMAGKNLEGMQQERENTREGEQRQGTPEHERGQGRSKSDQSWQVTRAARLHLHGQAAMVCFL